MLYPICVIVPSFAKIGRNVPEIWPIWFSIFQDGGRRHLRFWKFRIFNGWYVLEGRTASAAKFWRNRSNRSWDIAIFHYFKMAAVRHLGLSKVGNFNFRSHSEAQYASACQISRRSVEPFRRYGRFSIFQDGGRPPSWIGFTRVGTTYEEYLVVFVTVPNLVVIGAEISTVCKF